MDSPEENAFNAALKNTIAVVYKRERFCFHCRNLVIWQFGNQLLTAPPFYDMVAPESKRLEKLTIATMCDKNSLCPQRCTQHRAGVNPIHAARLARPLRVRRK